ncbi:hypothetical protein Ccrd_026350 [Cynara cardunculus var. scolymus]|uniref:Uncharacterized protein n=1 Tax=Cynara cardunculus var. scolymus TaxID=59895 RepID=A0A103QVA1_CYNCS|nr:hypothetical protein Ccrd_026350 [Cynara cardunculus var. scolymus]
MADLGGFHVNQHQIRVRKKSERIMKKTYFSNFKNTIDNRVDVDEDSEVGRTNDVHSNEGCSSKGKCLEIQQSTEADVGRSNVVPRPPQGSSKGKVLEILKTQEPTEAKVERTTGVPSIAQGSSKGKVWEILDTQETTGNLFSSYN